MAGIGVLRAVGLGLRGHVVGDETHTPWERSVTTRVGPVVVGRHGGPDRVGDLTHEKGVPFQDVTEEGVNLRFPGNLTKGPSSLWSIFRISNFSSLYEPDPNRFLTSWVKTYLPSINTHIAFLSSNVGHQVPDLIDTQYPVTGRQRYGRSQYGVGSLLVLCDSRPSCHSLSDSGEPRSCVKVISQVGTVTGEKRGGRV